MPLAPAAEDNVDLSEFAINESTIPTNSLGIHLIEGRYITRATLRDLSRVTEHVMRRLERDRIVQHAKLGRRGERLFTQETVQIVHAYMLQANELKPDRHPRGGRPPKNTGPVMGPVRSGPLQTAPITDAKADERAVAVFKLLEKGTRLHQIVISTGIGPDAVREIANAYAQCSRAIVLNDAAVTRLNTLPLESPIVTVDDIITTIRAGLKKRACAKCRQAERADSCVECIIGGVMAEIAAASPPPSEDSASADALPENDSAEENRADEE